MEPAAALLRVENLSVSYQVGRGWIEAVRGFRLEVEAGQIAGIVGESGSGKSTVARALMRYLPANGRTGPESRILFMEEELTSKTRLQMEKLWGAQIALVPQNPAAALNPSMRVGEQIAESLRHHLHLDAQAAHQKVIEGLARVRLPEPERLARRYPHELSGGQQQRVVIAMALATSPRLLILDEPTTALDVTTEAAILDLVRDLIREEGAGAVFVTHNLGVVAQLCDHVTVMYAGEIMAGGGVASLYARPIHPYTAGLLNSIVQPGQTKHDRALASIPGRPPFLAAIPPGCVFAPRCPVALAHCHIDHPLLESLPDGRMVSCHRWREIDAGNLNALGELALSGPLVVDNLSEERDDLLVIAGLVKHFPAKRTFREVMRGVRPAPVRAVDGINLRVLKGRTYGLVGESGSGKTTLSRVLIGLTPRTEGDIHLLDIPLNTDSIRQRGKDILAQIQMVFQNPQGSLNPYLTVGQALRRPLLKLTGLSRDEADRTVSDLLRAVNLQPEYSGRYPSELSGGEKQRVAIARAFASEPALILLDEPVSALDVSVQASVLNLLATLQAERETSYIFISHDLAVVAYLADYIAVMYLGQLFEVGYARDLFSPPLHPYTEALVSAIPVADPSHETEPLHLSDNIPGPRNIPPGCRFHTRCPRKIGAICEEEQPPFQDDGDGHFIRCHIPLDELAAVQQATFSPPAPSR